MESIEIQNWNKIVKPKLPAGPHGPFEKKSQQALANVLQEWTAKCIETHLREIVPEGKWKIQHKGKRFLGAIRNQEVDNWLWDDRAGLILAADPKHFQSQDSFRKNWQNGLNDLLAFTTNLHERFPMCAVLGVISFPEWAVTESDLKKVLNICKRSVPRERPNNAYGKFEGFALAIYNAKGDLIWPFDKTTRLDPASAFTDAANVIYSRTISLL
ncbi:MAG TPA: hypothetical protein VM658_05260 [bacterium]|nr:hypothetical protein [bacterium]